MSNDPKHEERSGRRGKKPQKLSSVDMLMSRMSRNITGVVLPSDLSMKEGTERSRGQQKQGGQKQHGKKRAGDGQRGEKKNGKGNAAEARDDRTPKDEKTSLSGAPKGNKDDRQNKANGGKTGKEKTARSRSEQKNEPNKGQNKGQNKADGKNRKGQEKHSAKNAAINGQAAEEKKNRERGNKGGKRGGKKPGGVSETPAAGGAPKTENRQKKGSAPLKEERGGFKTPVTGKKGAGAPEGTARKGGAHDMKVFKDEKLRVIALGGLNEIGKNITVYEYGDDIIVVDCGLAFPDDEMLGIDMVIPDFSYLTANKDKIRAVFITHGHEDHIGSLAYLLRDINVPIYGSPFSIGLIKKKLEEQGLDSKAKLFHFPKSGRISAGSFEVEPIKVNHSIAGAVGFAIFTPVGTVVQTGDFKIDSTPIDGEMIDLARFGEIGREGVLLLLSDSTNSERPGYSKTERTVGVSFDNIFRSCDKRIIIATFSSNVHRIQQILDVAEKYGRKVAVSGRSMLNVLEVANELGYIRIPDGLLIDLNIIDRYPKDKIVICTTGSQGEPMSALYRMAYSDHRKVEITGDDVVIISSSPIPGNEKSIYNMINELCRRGARVVHENLNELHVSGHACQEELKMMLGLIHPAYFMPVHGEYRHLQRHSELARDMGIPDSNIIISDIGKPVEINGEGWKFGQTVPSGQVMVDGLGVGDVGSVVLRDRTHLAQDGIIVVAVSMDRNTGEVVSGPEIVSRGFIYMRESEELLEDMKEVCAKALDTCGDEGIRDFATIKSKIKQGLSDLIKQRTKRDPMILPMILDV